MTRNPDTLGRSATRCLITALYGVAVFAVLAGCGGGGGGKSVVPATGSGTGAGGSASATPTPTPAPTPIPLAAVPAIVAFGGVNGSQQITVTDKGFSGTITAVSNDTTIVTLLPASVVVASPASSGVFVLTSIGIGTNLSGATTITISDGKLTINVPVTVSITGGSITYRLAVPTRPQS